MALADPYPFLLAGFTPEDVEEVLADLDYLHARAVWPYTLERTAEMIEDSADALAEFLRSVDPEALRNAMLPRRLKRRLLADKAAA
jgi:hypothetical protein